MPRLRRRLLAAAAALGVAAAVLTAPAAASAAGPNLAAGKTFISGLRRYVNALYAPVASTNW